ncbi:mitogen-activated protein kinase-binding protein 1 [Daktulosphaira vitifoliae]|uniref:mitogen-activated protein kinase-binding protein 1 n=1 Tax=Daktulosphaira vitifoliae TaxID=58002 RepID=UPI0021AA3117|nr:mitogen-activated protein kinase-binding protein 1 [Daktulosphaira vitifoliae]
MENSTPQMQHSKLIRPPTLKRGRSSDLQSSKIKLERVIGLTVSTNSSLDVDTNTGTIAYPAGCTVVFHNSILGTETHLSNICRKSITCLTFSSDGRYLATGECGHQSNVRIWDMTDITQVAELPGHKYGINCVAFSPNQKYLVSVGSQHDMIVNVWEWKSNLKYASNKVSAKIKALAFSDNGNFITIGNRHVKFWYLQSSRSTTYKEPVPLMGRSAILGEQRNNDFIDVCCGHDDLKDYTYAITKSGLLCEFNNRRLLDRWVELKTTSANCMAIGRNYIFIGCAEGIVRCFHPGTLQFITTLPRTHYLGVDVAQGHDISHMASIPSNAKYPDAIALAYDEINTKLTCVYNDHSLYIWDVKDIKRVGKSNSFLFHSACIWGVEMYPALEKNLQVPNNSFITCSSDDTIRVWNLDRIDSENNSLYQKNIYSNELLKIIYIDPELNYLKNTELSLLDKSDSSSYDGRNGVRAIRISPDGLHLASGDRSGNIRVHDLKTLKEVCLIEAHDAEVLYLDYSKYNDKVKLFASASRDRLIHVFNVNKDYDFVQTLDDHSSSITAVRFINSQNKLQMVSCGADKSIIFRNYNEDGEKNHQNGFVHDHSVSGKTTFYDMEVDPKQKHIMTACQDRNIRVYNTTSGKHTKTFKGSVGDEGSLIKVVLDQSGSFVATSCTDKTLCVYDYLASDCLTTMFGHSELVTGLRFTNDSKHLISASGDGCIFVWRMPLEIAKHSNLLKRNRPEKLPKPVIIDGNIPPYKISEEKENNSFSIPVDGQLPLWAKKQVLSDNMQNDTQLNPSMNRINVPKGQWAQRATNSSEPSSILQIPINKDDSDCFKDDSSVDSGTETSRSNYPESQKESLIIPKKTKRIPPVFVSNDFDENSTVQMVSEKSSSHLSDIHRIRNHTDDSSLGSFKNEELESNDHDGDIEDSESEWLSNEKVNNPIIYYPSNSNDLINDYTITKLDSDAALRMSQRKSKGVKQKDRLLSAGITDLSSHSMSGSQGSDDDDDATSTPSGESTDKSQLMMFSTSNERLDLIEKREQFLKNTFESLGGVEQVHQDNKNHVSSKRSISSQYKGSSVQQNTNIESQNKRNELQQRIEETRRTLQNLSTHSILKSSQSICDLSRNFGKSPSKLPVRNNYLTVDNHMNMGNTVRRVCSLTDLSTSGPSREGSSNSSFNNQKAMPRSLLKKPKSVTSNMQRSSSVSVLDQSDSESDISQLANGILNSGIPIRAMRPTISSQNKMIVNKSNLSRRRSSTTSQSTNALNTIGRNEDSSSEEFFTSLHNRSIPVSSQIKFHNSEKLRRNSTSLIRSVSEMNLKSPSSKLLDKHKNRNDVSQKLKINENQQKNIKNHVSLMANQLFQTADRILDHINGIGVSENGRISKKDVTIVIHQLEHIVEQGGIFSTQLGSSSAINSIQEYLDILIDVIKKRSSKTDV